MIKNDVPIGKNRTGIALSPIDKQKVLEIPEMTPASPNGAVLAKARGELVQEATVIGSVPPPASVKGIAETGTAAIKGVNVAVLLDKLGERLAFERTGVRLYDSLIVKCSASEAVPNGPMVAELEEIRAEELSHFVLVRDVMESLGGDPTAQTPSADVIALASNGIVKVLADSRMSLRQSLGAILLAELADVDGWSLLIELTRNAGHDEIASRFEEASAREELHLAKARRWLTGTTLAAEKPLSQI